MSEGPSEPEPAVPAREQVTKPRVDSPETYSPTQAVSSTPPTVPKPVMQPHEATQVVQPHAPTELDPRGTASRSNPTVVRPIPATEVVPTYAPTEVSQQGPVSWTNATTVAPQGPASAAPPGAATVPPAAQPDPAWADPPTSFSPVATQASRQPASEVLRYGPGVPPSQAGVSAEQVWRTGQVPQPVRRPVRLRRLAGTLLTVILLVAAGVLLFFRFYHGPFHVTGVKIISAKANGCTVNVTGRISTNGQPGTVSYEWVYTPQQEAPQPLSDSVPSGQNTVYVIAAVLGQGHGTATEKITLQLLGPNQGSDSTVVSVSC